MVQDFSSYKLMYEKRNFYANLIINIFIYLFLFISAVFLLFTFIYYPSRVKGASMQPTFNDGNNDYQMIYINRFANYKRNDIVIIEKTTSQSEEKYIIKRIIGIGNDNIKLTLNESEDVVYLYINDKLLFEPYILDYKNGTNSGMRKKYDEYISLYQKQPELFPNGFEGGIIVPDGSVFALGDNRINSEDSLKSGAFNNSQLKGRVDFTVPFNETPIIYILKKFTPFN